MSLKLSTRNMIQRLNDDTDLLSRAEIVQVATEMEQHPCQPANRSQSQQKMPKDKITSDLKPKVATFARNASQLTNEINVNVQAVLGSNLQQKEKRSILQYLSELNLQRIEN